MAASWLETLQISSRFAGERRVQGASWQSLERVLSQGDLSLASSQSLATLWTDAAKWGFLCRRAPRV